MIAAQLRWAAISHSGSRKPRNEDSLVVFSSSPTGAETLSWQGSLPLTTHDLVFAISDGMGGGNAGDIASATIILQMTEIIPQTFKAGAAGIFPDSLAHLGQALGQVHSQINAAAVQHSAHSGMAATLALAWFTPENLYLANVGDSRIYRYHAGELLQISRDHTTAWGQWQRGEMSEFQFRIHPRRSALYEVIGGGYLQVHPYFAAIPYQVGDRFLICSDGLIDGLWERHLAAALANCPDDPQSTASNLLKRAIDNSGIDDTSLVVIAVNAISGS
jgi:PPM family protein phosphatase